MEYSNLLTVAVLALSAGLTFGQATTTLDVSGVQVYLDEYEIKAAPVRYEEALGEWNYMTNITKETQAIFDEKSEAAAVFKAEQAAIASQVPLDQITDPVNRRLMKKIAVKGNG